MFTGEWRAGPCARVSVWGTPRAASARAGTGPGMRRRLRERRRRPSTRDLPSAIPPLETPPGRGKAWTRRGCARGSRLSALAPWRGSPVRAGLREGRGKPSRTGSSGIHSWAVLRSDRCRPGPEPRSESPVLLRSAPAVSWAPLSHCCRENPGPACPWVGRTESGSGAELCSAARWGHPAPNGGGRGREGEVLCCEGWGFGVRLCSGPPSPAFGRSRRPQPSPEFPLQGRQG